MFLITVEGLDCAGRTTFASNLAKALQTNGQLVWLVNGVEFGLPGPKAKQHYYRLSRSEKQKYWVKSFTKLHEKYLAKRKIYPQQTPIIICDRWYDSAIVYQGRTDQWQTMLPARTTLESQLKPQLKFLIQTPLPLIRQRWLAKGNHGWETEVFEMFWKLYQRIIGSDQNTIILSGTTPIAQLVAAALQHVKIQLASYHA